MTVLMDLKFDSVAKCLDWWSIFNNGVSTFALPRVATDNTGSYAEIFIAPRKATLNGVAASFAVKENYSGKFAPSTVMDSNLDFSNGTAVSCYDPDTTRRGIFNKQGPKGTGQWNQQVFFSLDKLWPDPNHPEKLLELIFCSWANCIPLHPGSSNNLGWNPQTPPGPFDNDWRNLKITFDMRVKDLHLGANAKICQHVQGDVPRQTWALPKRIEFAKQPEANSHIEINGVAFTFVAASPSGNQVLIGANLSATIANLVARLSASTNPGILLATYSASGNSVTIQTKPWQDSFLNAPFRTVLSVKAGTTGSTNATLIDPHATPNYIFTRSLISDQLGFGIDSWGKKNKVSHVTDSGRRKVVLQYTPNDEDWECLGAVDRPLSFYDYTVAPVAEVLQRMIGNSYMMVVHPMPQPEAKAFERVAGGIAESERTAGTIMIYGIKIER
jgi:hypothetical protein